MKAPAQRGLYAHFPWCVKKCPYCDFNSHPLREPLDETAYVERLLADLDEDLVWAGTKPFASVFLGGGTPSLFSPKAIKALLQGINSRAELSDDAEVTLEANPGAVDAGHFAGYREAGVNRLSIGVQSFDATLLNALGRIHDAEDSFLAIEAARGAGFDRINIDLMHGLPGQSIEGAMADLDTAIATGVAHLSWYQLTIEPRTEFARHPPILPAEDCLETIEAEGLRRLNRAGLHRYEISAYARTGEESRHNLNYWRFGDYLGIGAGAHGKVTFPERDSIERTEKPKSPARYNATPHAQLRSAARIDPEAVPLEFMMNALRLTAGVAESHFQTSTGLSLASIDSVLRRLRQRCLLQDDCLATTPLGLRYLDSVVAEFS